MQPQKILDTNLSTSIPAKPTIFKFQIAEFILVGLFMVLLLLRPLVAFSKMENLVVFFCFAILAFFAVRIYLELKNKLITGFGVLLKLLLLNASTVVMFGMLFQIMRWEMADLMSIVALMTFAMTHIVYGLTLKEVAIPVKSILFFNALAAGILAVGIVFKMESWANGQAVWLGGLVLTIVSLFSFGFIFQKELTTKEQYHAFHFIARTIGILLGGAALLV